MRAFVINKSKKPLMPCTGARARELLKNKKTAVYSCYPFTIMIFDREDGNLQEIELKVDPGSKITAKSRRPLIDAAAVNVTRFTIGNTLKSLGLKTSFSTGGRTKYNRCSQGYPKGHWIDAACVGETGEKVDLSECSSILEIKAKERGSRQMCRPDRYGFPRTTAKKKKLVSALVPKGKKAGYYFGILSVRSTGNFNIKTSSKTVEGIHARYCLPMQKKDGYEYNFKMEVAFSSRHEVRGIHAEL